MAKILLAEDDSDLREVHKKILIAAGHQVVAVEDGVLALEKYRQEKFDLIITDSHMPGLTGKELIQQITRLEEGRGKTTPIVMITGEGPCCEAILLKPFKPQLLISVIKTLVAEP